MEVVGAGLIGIGLKPGPPQVKGPVLVAGVAVSGIGMGLLVWDAATTPNEMIEQVNESLAPLRDSTRENQELFEKLFPQEPASFDICP